MLHPNLNSARIAHVVLLTLPFFGGSCIWTTSAPPVASGAIVFHVEDEYGKAVEGAACNVCFVKNDSLFDQRNVEGKTDKEGIVRLEGKTNGEIVFSMEKEGFHTTRGRYWMFRREGLAEGTVEAPNQLYGIDLWPGTGENEGISRGHWMPKERHVRVILKKQCDFPATKEKALNFRKVLEVTEVGVDCQAGDWMPPCGAGVHEDARLEIKSTPDGIEVWLNFGEDGGGILLPMDHWSQWPYAKEAPSAGYRRAIKLPVDEMRPVVGGVSMQMRDYYVVFQTRVKTDKNGNFVSAHYGVISWVHCSIGTKDMPKCNSFGEWKSHLGEAKAVSLFIKSFQCRFNDSENDRRLE